MSAQDLAFIRVCSCGMSQVSIRAPLEAEIERLARRVAIADVNLGLCADEANRLRAEVERLRAEVADLRAALEEPTPLADAEVARIDRGWRDDLGEYRRSDGAQRNREADDDARSRWGRAALEEPTP